MTEDQIQQTERALDTADADATAAVLVAAIVRLGQLGRDGAVAFNNLAPVDCDPTYDRFEEGFAQLLGALDGVTEPA